MFDLAQIKINQMRKHLESRPDEKLINGYKKAMEDYKETNDENCLVAANEIKREIDKRGLDL